MSELQIWESIMRTAIDKRESYPVGTDGHKAGWAAVEELQKVFESKFSRRFTWGYISD